MRGRILALASLVGGLLMSAVPAQATMLQKFDLADMVERADTIFRGEVTSVEQSTIAVGGGELSVINYRIKVEDLIKGSADSVQGADQFIDVSMVGRLEPEQQSNGIIRFSAFDGVPKLSEGGEYVLYMTQRSSIGLSVPVGLGQGTFKIMGADKPGKDAMAMNELENKGLGMEHDGPISYIELKAATMAAMR